MLENDDHASLTKIHSFLHKKNVSTPEAGWAQDWYFSQWKRKVHWRADQRNRERAHLTGAFLGQFEDPPVVPSGSAPHTHTSNPCAWMHHGLQHWTSTNTLWHAFSPNRQGIMWPSSLPSSATVMPMYEPFSDFPDGANHSLLIPSW